VTEILTLLDEAISGLRVAGGQSQFELALVANPAEVELEPLLGMPTAREQIGQLIRVAELTPRVAERVSLFQAALALLAEAGEVIPSEVADAYRQLAEDRIRTEQFIDGRYAALTERLMASATRAAQSAQVRDVERVLERIPIEDDRLGRRRPNMVAALNASVLARLEDARRLRLLRDRWTLRRGLYREYRRSVGSELRQLVSSEDALRAVRDLHGPAPAVLLSLRGKLLGGAERLSREPVPSDLQGTHDLMVSAWRFAERALEVRYQAVQTGSLETAWEASSAAAGALLMLTRAQQELDELLKPPQLQ